MLKLRPHHLLCIKFYQGKGYSEDFTNNMNYILKKLNSNDNLYITLIDQCDDICTACPHKTSMAECDTFNKVNSLDKLVVKTFDLTLNKTYSYKDLKSIIDTNLTPKNHKEICKDCEWFELGLCKLN